MRVDTKKEYECCGCTACASICPHDAIRMEADSLGFLYPRIDESKCVDCSLCVKVCQFHEGYARELRWEEPEVYGVRLRDGAALQKSQSGGAFYGLAREVVESGGVVYGAGFTPEFRVVHKRVEDLVSLEELRGSKYVQSDLRGIFRRVKEDLSSGRRVLFSGTPCQVSGLQSFVGKRLSAGLFTVDLVCHGVPSPAVWSAYLSEVCKKRGEPCVGVKFRDKSFGWASHYESFWFRSGAKISGNSFGYLFYTHCMLRESCYHCPYTNLKRVGDVTVADFWGWTKHHTEFNDNRGVSLVLVNSSKGKELFSAISGSLEVVRSNTEECLQPQLQYPSKPNAHRAAFRKAFEIHGWSYVSRRYGNEGWRYKCRQVCVKLKHIARKILLRR